MRRRLKRIKMIKHKRTLSAYNKFVSVVCKPKWINWKQAVYHWDKVTCKKCLKILNTSNTDEVKKDGI